MKFFVSILIFSLTSQIFAQNTAAISVVELSDSIQETSGLLFINNTFITHNDSGDGPYLYQIDTLTGNVIRNVYVSFATSVDWEDICSDNNYIYVGDFGNNLGSRTDLKVLKINKNDYFNTTNDTVVCEIISFNFANQTTFTPNQYFTNYDIEALCSVNDSLFIFTKNWGNSKTNYYSLSKNAGNYSIVSSGEINTNGLVTGAIYNLNKNEILLCGYTVNTSFITKISNFTLNNFANGVILKHTVIPSSASNQIEGITYIENQGYYFSTELHSSGNSELRKIPKQNLVKIEKNTFKTITVYPNPVKNTIMIKGVNVNSLKLFNINNQVVKSGNKNELNVNQLSNGTYYLVIETKSNTIVKKIIISN